MKASKEQSTQAAPKAGSQSAAPAHVTLAHQLGNAGLLRILQAKRAAGDPHDDFEPKADRVADAPCHCGGECPHCRGDAPLIQTKLTINEPGDRFEQEADRVADHVMRMPEPASVQGTCDGCEELRRAVQTTPVAPGPVKVDTATENSIATLSGRGSGLPDAVRGFMEPRFNADFSAVRIHNDAHAHDLARAVNAQAFTVGHNVVFGAGHYAPETESGRHLLAHELTHVMQSNGASGTQHRKQATGVAAHVGVSLRRKVLVGGKELRDNAA